ncbi:MAG TPA: phage terminase large subunit [Candidatus Rikenella faecigallinarum]|uniref:Phage terminase large subunit n=1 Tax=Candidatus Rikenella faecigallinarum TaxID=2838745 RepID=A0A9D1TXR7_9BACT|nr:phage terminase large subunit [Candidatus Rikenella faecigallinarum]
MSRNSPENQNPTQKIPKNKKPVLELNKTAAERARRSINTFVSAINPQFDWSPFHNTYYQLLQKFAEGTIQRLIISVPPQHGKSLGASVFLPAFMLGKNPNLKITVVSYSLALARRFAAQIQRIIDDENYHNIFPHTQLKNCASQNPKNKSARRTAHEFDCVGHDGGLRSVGRTGSLTGNTVDLLILDDLYKDALEANSPLIRERVWEWYNAVARTRLHNTAQELIVETRWHEDDIIGRLKKCENVVELTSWEQLDRPKPDTWFALSFEALKTSPPSQLDPRKPGEALWPKKHSVQWLKQRRKADPNLFEALFQGNPEPREGRLYETFQTYRKLPQNPLKRANYTDTADTGNDKLCSICYLTDENGLCYITDVVYTDLAMELTETAVAQMLQRNQTTQARIESNNGGRGFGRAVEKNLFAQGYRTCAVKLFHQTANKESRILTYAPTVQKLIRMPEDWKIRWPEFAADLETFKRIFRANAHDDAPDALTGIVETENAPKTAKIRLGGFTKR